MIPDYRIIVIMLILFLSFDLVNRFVVSKRVDKALELDYKDWTRHDMIAIRNKMVHRMRSKYKRNMLHEYNRIRTKLKNGQINRKDYDNILRLLKG